MDTENWDLTDETGRPVGRSHPRGEPIPRGLYHVVASVCAVRSDGRVLLSQRAASKDHPLDWEIPAGSVLAGESSVEGAIRDLCEEVGIDVSNDSTTFIGRFTEDSALFDLYAAPVASEATVSPDAIEVADTRWVTIAEFDEMFASGAMAAPWKPRMAAFRKRFGEVVNELSPAR